MVNTVFGAKFQMWVQLRIEERNEKAKDMASQDIAIDKELFELLQSSTRVSSKSTSHLYVSFVNPFFH